MKLSLAEYKALPENEGLSNRQACIKAYEACYNIGKYADDVDGAEEWLHHAIAYQVADYDISLVWIETNPHAMSESVVFTESDLHPSVVRMIADRDANIERIISQQ